MRCCVSRWAKCECAVTLLISSCSIAGFSCRSDVDRPDRFLSLSALNTGASIAFARNPTDQIRADAERLSPIVLEMQRRFVLHLCTDLSSGIVSFPQFFLLPVIDHNE